MKRKLRLGRFTEKELAVIEKLSDVAKERFFSLDKRTQKKLLEHAMEIAKQQQAKEKMKNCSKKKKIYYQKQKKSPKTFSKGEQTNTGLKQTKQQSQEYMAAVFNAMLSSTESDESKGKIELNIPTEQEQLLKSLPLSSVSQMVYKHSYGKEKKAKNRLKVFFMKKQLHKKMNEAATKAGKTLFGNFLRKRKLIKGVKKQMNPIRWLIVLLVLLILVILFLIVSIVTQDNSNTYQCQVSEETENYRVMVSYYCEKYDIEDYVDLCLAVMEQESGGKGIDVMQAEQSYYNKEPPIDTTEESIDCGVHELSDCLTESSVKSPSDISSISLALQGYNFGNGYISWAKTNYGGYSEDNAKIFSAEMCSSLHLSSYGDVEYVPHVLRYYVQNGKTEVTNEKAAALIKELKENNRASASVWNLIEKGASLTGAVTYGMLDPPRQDDGRDSPTVLDCSSFVAWSFHKSGYTGIPYTSTTKTFIESSKFETIEASDLTVGDIGLKSATAPTGGANHVGIYCGKLKNGTKVWLHCTSSNRQSLTGNSSGVLMSSYTNFTYFRRLKNWEKAS